MVENRGRLIAGIIGGFLAAGIGIAFYFMRRAGVFTPEASRSFMFISGALVIAGLGGLINGLIRLFLPRRTKRGLGYLIGGTAFLLAGLAMAPGYTEFWPWLTVIFGVVMGAVFLYLLFRRTPLQDSEET
jgi:hypothetical protein